MVRHLVFVAAGFRIVGFVLALASIAALVDLADTLLVIRRMPPPDNSAPLDIGTYGLVGLIANGARAFGYLVHAAAAVAFVIMVALAIAAALLLLLGTLMYFTGRGIIHHATWARLVGLLLSIGLAVASSAMAAGLMASRRDLAPFAAFPIGLSFYVLWVLIWRFTD